jgi:hypothetical protein
MVSLCTCKMVRARCACVFQRSYRVHVETPQYWHRTSVAQPQRSFRAPRQGRPFRLTDLTRHTPGTTPAVMTDVKANVADAAPAPGGVASSNANDKPLPELSPAEFRVYNRWVWFLVQTEAQ